MLLDSAESTSAHGRWTLAACHPLETLEWSEESRDDPFEDMRQRLRRTESVTRDTSGRNTLPFVGGWIGYLGYEAGRFIERLPQTTRADVGLPLARFGLYDSAAIYDHQRGEWALVAIDLPDSREPAERRLAFWEDLLERACHQVTEPGPLPARVTSCTHNLSHDDYLSRVEAARRYIEAGDIFQVNLARRETYTQQEPLWKTYLRLRQVNPGSHSAFMQWYPGPTGHASRETSPCGILSASPEMFLNVVDRTVTTRPIKGTRPRSRDAVVDRAHQAELASSAKDRAELAMIVDLLRNDLGRVCRYGSICVDPGDRSEASFPYTLETHPTVHHLVATIRGELAEDRDVIDLLRACFPGGSITGAPKVRAMEIIDELEPTQRSVYTGSIGYFSLHGRASFNIAIRTLIASRGHLHLYAGGGIVADSEPEMEFRETQAKALGLQRALGMGTGSSAPGAFPLDSNQRERS